MSSFFSAFGIASASQVEDPFVIPANTYQVAITKAGVEELGKDIKLPYFKIELTVRGGAQTGKTAASMHRMIPWTAQERLASKGEDDHQAMNARTVNNYKVELMSFGITEEGLDQFDPRNPAHCAMLLGFKGTAFLETKGGFNNFKDFKREVPGAPVQEAAPVIAPSALFGASAAPTPMATAAPTAAVIPDGDALAALLGDAGF